VHQIKADIAAVHKLLTMSKQWRQKAQRCPNCNCELRPSITDTPRPPEEQQPAAVTPQKPNSTVQTTVTSLL
jgi:uncharacterized protein with PIN domain